MTVSQSYEITPVDQLHFHPRNPRRSDVGGLADSIRVNGFYGTVVAQKSTGYILAGNHRVEAAMECGITEVPVVWVDVGDAAALRILLADNRTSDQAGYDNAGLTELLRELKQDEIGLDGTGFDDESLAELERVAGILGAEKSSWLDRFLSSEGRAPEHDELSGDVGDAEARRRAGLDKTSTVDTQFFSVSYMYLLPERTEVVGILNRVRQEQNLETASQALLWLVRDWAETNPIGDLADIPEEPT